MAYVTAYAFFVWFVVGIIVGLAFGALSMTGEGGSS
jgi:hypothetical protein